MHGRRGGAFSTAPPHWAIPCDALFKEAGSWINRRFGKKWEGIVTDFKLKNVASLLLILMTFVFYLVVLVACTTEQASPVTPADTLPNQAPASASTGSPAMNVERASTILHSALDGLRRLCPTSSLRA